MIYTFGSGTLFGTRVDSAGVATPVRFGILQDVSVEFSANTKELFGGQQFALAVARGTSKIQCKAKFAQISGRLFASLYFGVDLAAGQTALVENEYGTVGGGNAITVAHNATWTEDLGVYSASTGLPLQRVAANPQSGQYAAAAGVYLFHASAAGTAMRISYLYAAAGGQKLTIANQALGVAPTFKIILQTRWNDKTMLCILNRCMATKLALATKIEDFTIPEMDFGAFADDSGVVGEMNFGEPGEVVETGESINNAVTLNGDIVTLDGETVTLS